MRNWKTNLGGAISITGTTLIATGVVPALADVHSPLLTWIALVGFILSAVGKGLTALFAADAATVAELTSRVDSIKAP